MNFVGNYIYEYDYKIGIVDEEYDKYNNDFISRSFYKSLSRYKNKKIKFFLVLLFILSKQMVSKECLYYVKCILKILLNKNKYFVIDNMLKKIFFNMENNRLQRVNWFWLSRKTRKIPKSLKHIKFVIRRQVGPILILSKSDVFKMLNSNTCNSLYKYSKKCFAPEEFIFLTLYFNIIGNTKCSKTPPCSKYFRKWCWIH